MHGRSALLLAFLAGVLASWLWRTTEVVGAPTPPDFAGVIARADAGVVHVTTVLQGKRAPASSDDAVGAGFVFAADGWVVTSRHIVQGAKEVHVGVPGRGRYEARIVGVDEATDVALLRIGATGLAALPVGDPRRLRKGEWVLAAGSPFHLPRSWSVGIVSGLGRSGVGISPRGYEDFIQTDAASNVGNSGGPLLNVRGEVVGMMTAILSRTGRSEGISLALPIDVVWDTARRLRTGQPLHRPSLGVMVRETGRGGLEVTRFQPGFGGRGEGLRVGDVILEIDGTPTPRTVDLQRAVWRHRAGETIVVSVQRGGRRVQVPARLR